MAIKPKCDKCKKELKDFGGILLSPPKKNMVKKIHLCCKCYREVLQGISKKFKKCQHDAGIAKKAPDPISK